MSARSKSIPNSCVNPSQRKSSRRNRDFAQSTRSRLSGLEHRRDSMRRLTCQTNDVRNNRREAAYEFDGLERSASWFLKFIHRGKGDVRGKKKEDPRKRER